MIAKPTAFSLLQPAFLCLLVLWIAGCGRSDNSEIFHTLDGPTMGTWYNVKFQSMPEGVSESDVQQSIDSVLSDINQKMSTYLADSELSQFNKLPPGQPATLSPQTFQVLTISEQVFQESGGAFDITVGPLVNLWGFGPDKGSDEVPSPDEIRARLDAIGAQYLSLENGNARKQKPIQLDLSAVAKGYAVDKVAEVLESQGITRYMVEVGGEIKVGQVKLSGEPWRIAIEEPNDLQRVIQKVLSLTSVAVATSGDYRNFYEKNGHRYSHTIDPRTGSPVAHKLASVTVIHRSCAYADAYATALTVLGPQEGMALANKLGLAVYMLVKSDTGFDVLQTESFSDYVDAVSI